MKQRITALFLALCMILTAGAIPAFAEGETEYLDIVYNGSSVGHYFFDDDSMKMEMSDTYAYLNDDWISMADAAWFLRAIGADAQINGVSVTAQRGGVKFESDGNDVTVTSGEEVRTGKLSAAPQKRDMQYRETLVYLSSLPEPVTKQAVYYPVRDLADAFGLDIGFTAKGTYDAGQRETSVVTLFDADAYVDRMAKTAPNLYKMLDCKMHAQGVSDSVYSLTFDFTPGNEETIKTVIDMAVQSQMKDSLAAVTSTFDADLEQLIGFLSNGEYTLPKLTGITVDIMMDKTTIYFKTNLFEKLYEADSKNMYFDLLSNVLDRDQWIKLDVKQMLEDIGPDSEAMGELLPGDMSAYYNGEITGVQYLKTVIDSMYRQQMQYAAPLESMNMIDMVFNAYAALDSYIKVTDTENGGYTVQMDMTTDDFIAVMKDAALNSIETIGDIAKDAPVPTDEMNEEFERIRQMLQMDIHVKAEYTPDGMNSSAEMTMGLNLGENIGRASFTMKGTDQSKAADKTDIPEIPKRAIDINTLIRMMDAKM